jgi:hypothetical protein
MKRRGAPTSMEFFMRRILPLSLLAVSAGILSACNPDETIATPNIPTAGVRFINAVPDSSGTYGMDFHFVDLPENNVQYRVSFRNGPLPSATSIQIPSNIEFKAAQAGSRHFRVFLDDTIQSVASTVLVDSTVTLTAGHNYTFIMWGNGRSSGSDKMHMTGIDETVADPGALVAIRVLNATNAPIDASYYVKGGAVPGSPNWSNIPAYSASSYVTTSPALIMYDVRSAGSATAMFADLQAPPGAAAFSTAGTGGKIDMEAIPGTSVAGSAITLIVFPKSVSGSKAAQFASAGGAFTWDRRPPLPPGV